MRRTRSAIDSDFSTLTVSVSVNSSVCLDVSLMAAPDGFPRVFKTVQAGFFDAHALEFCIGKVAQTIENLDTQIFGGRHMLAKFRDLFVEIRVIERLDHGALDK